MPQPATSIDSKSLADSLDMLRDITERAREMGLGLVKYPVADVERVVAVLTAGRPRVRVVEPTPFVYPKE